MGIVSLDVGRSGNTGLLAVKSVIMKKLNVVVGMLLTYIIGLCILFFALSFASCANGHWYKSRHDGCRQSSGYAGYGNGK